MEIILINLFVVTIALAVFVGAHRIPRAGVWSTYPVLFSLSACVTSPVGLLLVLVLWVLAIGMPQKFKVPTRLAVGGTLTLILGGVIGQQGFEALSARRQLREQYPIQSFANRLETEAAIVADPQSAFSQAYGASTDFAPQVVDRVNLIEEGTRPSIREWELRNLHDLHEGEARAFNIAAGFGVGRMRRSVTSDPEPIALEPLSPLPDGDDESFLQIDGLTIRKPEPVESTAAPESDPLARTVPAFIVNPSVLTGLHFASEANFIPDGSLGYVPRKQQASGFMSHRFAEPLPPLDAADKGTWQVVRLELVSLLKFKQPRVYVSKELPQMEQLQSVPTRALDEFEAGSLTQLWRDESVVIAEEPTRIRMLGALRATKQCLDCHSVQRGQLLGAFSYDLRQQRAAH